MPQGDDRNDVNPPAVPCGRGRGRHAGARCAPAGCGRSVAAGGAGGRIHVVAVVTLWHGSNSCSCNVEECREPATARKGARSRRYLNTAEVSGARVPRRRTMLHSSGSGGSAERLPARRSGGGARRTERQRISWSHRRKRQAIHEASVSPRAGGFARRGALRLHPLKYAASPPRATRGRTGVARVVVYSAGREGARRRARAGVKERDPGSAPHADAAETERESAGVGARSGGNSGGGHGSRHPAPARAREEVGGGARERAPGPGEGSRGGRRECAGAGTRTRRMNSRHRKRDVGLRQQTAARRSAGVEAGFGAATAQGSRGRSGEVQKQASGPAGPAGGHRRPVVQAGTVLPAPAGAGSPRSPSPPGWDVRALARRPAARPPAPFRGIRRIRGHARGRHGRGGVRAG